jgi:hypothetical protein
MSNKFVCFACEQRFNLNLREPIFLNCCGKTACRQCVTTKMIKNEEHARQNVIKMGDYECSNCHSDCYYQAKIEQPLPI